MNGPGKSNCDQNRIGRFLKDELNGREEQAFVRHLDQCPTCRRRLRDSTAEPSWWREAQDFLQEDEVDREYTHSAVLTDTQLPRPVRKPDVIAQLVIDSLAPTDDPRMLGRLGHYEIVGVIGFGGMGVVLKGFDAPLNRHVAIKVLSPQLASSGAARKRFAREAQAAAAVIHENVIAIHNVAEANDLPYLVMPYVSGPSLQKRLDEQGPLDTVEILRIGMQIAAGLAAAHAQGLVHRDVKPANILLEHGVERVLLTDFGLARAADDASLTHSGVIAGTPQYMSPEQARGEPVDVRSDLFSLGSVLYTMCTGRPPFRAETPYGVLRRISESPPRAIRELVPTVPEWLCEIIDQLHAKEPGQRFQAASEVAELLGRWLRHVQQPMTIPAPARLRHTRKATGLLGGFPRLIVAATIGLACLLAFFAYRDGQDAPVQPSRRGAATAKQITTPQDVRSSRADLKDRLDDKHLFDGYNQVDAGASYLQREWSRSLPLPAESNFTSTIKDVERQMDELSQRIEHEPFSPGK